jgi:hypothetical protein
MLFFTWHVHVCILNVFVNSFSSAIRRIWIATHLGVETWLSFCVQFGMSETTEKNRLKLYTLFWDTRSVSKAHNSYMDFDRIMALAFELVQALDLLSSSRNSRERCATDTPCLDLECFRHYMYLMFHNDGELSLLIC